MFQSRNGPSFGPPRWSSSPERPMLVYDPLPFHSASSSLLPGNAKTGVPSRVHTIDVSDHSKP